MNQLKSPKTVKATSDILGDRLKVIDFLMKSGKFHNTSELHRQLEIPTARLRDILQSRCEGYVTRQGDRYGYLRTERRPPKPETEVVLQSVTEPIKVTDPKPKTEDDFLAKMTKKENRKLRSQLPALRTAEAARIRRLNPNISIERATLMAYQRHPDL